MRNLNLEFESIMSKVFKITKFNCLGRLKILKPRLSIKDVDVGNIAYPLKQALNMKNYCSIFLGSTLGCWIIILFSTFILVLKNNHEVSTIN